MKITNERMTHHMTKEEKLRVFEKAEEKCFTCLDGLHVEDMGSEQALRLVDHIRAIWYAEDCLRNERSVTPSAEAAPDPVSEEQPAEPVPAETAAEAPKAEEDAPAPAEEAETGEAVTYDRNEICVTLNRLHRAGKINVAEIFETMGYRTLSEIPASEYGRLMQLAGVE